MDRQDERVLSYSRVASRYKELFIHELDGKPLDRKFYDLFYDRVVNKGTVLELGCGPGEVSNYLWSKGLKITGIDISDKMVEAARQYNDQIEFKVGSALSLEYENESVSGVAAPYLIVNFTVDEVKKAVKEIHRVLKTDGIFLISFHIGNNEELVIPDFLEENNRLSFRLFRLETIKKIILETGFSITEVVIKEPYAGEKTTRAYIFAGKTI